MQWPGYLYSVLSFLFPLCLAGISGMPLFLILFLSLPGNPTSCLAVDHSAFNHTKSQQIHLLTAYKHPTTSSSLTHVGLSPHFLRATHHLFYKICNCKFFLRTFESSILFQHSASFPTQKYFSQESGIHAFEMYPPMSSECLSSSLCGG